MPCEGQMKHLRRNTHTSDLNDPFKLRIGYTKKTESSLQAALVSTAAIRGSQVVRCRTDVRLIPLKGETRSRERKRSNRSQKNNRIKNKRDKKLKAAPGRRSYLV